ncbi:MAG: M56 family metallopeptidase [candidate division Zixibacteria bacterium]|nr:M56 family metallopeptidase [candidate division Zixibacteria bacterium]
MSDFLFQMGLSNACLSLALGIVAMVVGAKARRPQLAHMLWLLVFIKLVTPPIVTIPIVTIPAQGETAVAINDHSRPGPQLTNSRQFDVDAQPSAAWNHARVWLPPIWLLGSVVVFVVSMVRVCRFSRLLAKKSEVAPQELQTAAVKIARRLGLNKIPTILTTSANLSPMVWWTGGKVRIVIPTALLDQMDAHEWHWVLAHELAHVRRRDYLVRWLEWLACVLFWWNPVVWWAQHNLRAMEEICCDELVISCLSPKPKYYAKSLLSAVEFLARPVLRPPAMASEINSGGFLERRFKMIVSETPKRSNSRWLQICVLLCAVVVLPLGIASAQDYEAVERRLGEGVAEGELTLKQASVMMDALKKAGGAKKDQDPDRAEAYLMKVKKELGELVEAGRISKEDAAKRYEGAVKGIKERMAAGRRQRGDDKQREYEGFERRIKAAVEAGKMTREQAREKLEDYKKRIGR